MCTFTWRTTSCFRAPSRWNKDKSSASSDRPVWLKRRAISHDRYESGSDRNRITAAADDLRLHWPAIPVAAGNFSGSVESDLDQRPAFPGGPFTVLASGPRARPDLRLAWKLHHRDRLLLLGKDGPAHALCREPRLGKLGSVDLRRYAALGGQRQRVELARPAAGIGGASTHGLPDFFRGRERPSVQARAGV